MPADAELFTPSLTQTTRRDLPAGSRPWRLSSQFYTAMFGGPLAAGLIGYLNGKRLGLSQERLWAIAGVGIAGFVALAIVSAALLDTSGRGRGIVAVAGLVCYLGVRELQKDSDRLYGLDRDDDEAYDSLWNPGLVIALAFGIGQAVLLVVVL